MKTKIIISIGFIILGFIIGGTGATDSGLLSGGWLGALLATGVALLFWALVLTPQLLINGLIILITATTLPFLGGAYTLQAAGFADYVGGSVALFLAYAIGLWFTSRLGKYKSVINVSIVSLSLFLPGLVLLEIFPEFGLNNARVSILVATVLVCGGVSWVKESILLLLNKMRRNKEEDIIFLPDDEIDPRNASTAWKRIATAEKHTAEILHQLPRGVFVFHDVNIPKTHITIGHIVVSDEGVTLLTSVSPTGMPYQDPTQGLIIPGVDVNETAWKLYQAKMGASKALKIPAKHIRTSIILTGSNAEGFESTTFAMYGENNYREPLAKILVINHENLLAEVTPQFGVWSAVKTQHIARSIRIKFKPALIPKTIQWKDGDAPIRISYLDEDGQETLSVFYPQQSTEYNYRVGQAVEVLTTEGYVTGLIIAGSPYRNEDGEFIVKVKETPERAAFRSGRSYRTYLFPVSSIRPAARGVYG